MLSYISVVVFLFVVFEMSFRVLCDVISAAPLISA